MANHKKYRVTLTAQEWDELENLVSRGKGDARKLARARVLLQCDESDAGPRRTDDDLAAALDVGVRTVERVRERFEEGFEAALVPRPTSRTYSRRLDGAQEARLITPACSRPPDCKSRRTLRLLAGRMVELNNADALSHETVRQVLKKTRSSRT